MMTSLFRRSALAGALLLAALVAACAPQAAVTPPSAVVPPASPPPAPPQGLQCLDELARRGAVYQFVAERASANGCRLTNGINLFQSSVLLDRPATLTCPLAIALYDFETRIVQPAAHKWFKKRLIQTNHFGAYDCRYIRGTRRLSEHAQGLAIDIGGFELDGGIRVSVKEHWQNAGPRSRFLQEVAKGACEIFSVVLTPKSNHEHHDHFHLDLGARPHCGG
jgi:hypothetical protein